MLPTGLNNAFCGRVFEQPVSCEQDVTGLPSVSEWNRPCAARSAFIGRDGRFRLLFKTRLEFIRVDWRPFAVKTAEKEYRDRSHSLLILRGAGSLKIFSEKQDFQLLHYKDHKENWERSTFNSITTAINALQSILCVLDCDECVCSLFASF